MPQGKGTYGSQVGRPSKKKYNKGGNVDPFSTRNPEGVPAEQLVEMMENQGMANEGIPTSNAQERSQMSPDVEQYGLGGIIKGVVGKYKSKKEGKKREKSRKKAVEDFPITGIVQPKKKGLKPAKVPSNPPLIKGNTAKEKIIHAIPGLSKTPAGKRALKNKADKNKKVKNKMKKVAPKGGHSLEPASITKSRKKTKQWV